MTTPTIQTREVDEPASVGESCGICRRQISRYTCPSCNLFYCSLNCFRSESHTRCSETFYRKEIETGIKSGSSTSKEDRTKLIELLKRIEDESVVDEVEFPQPDGESEDDSLAHRFSAIDISSASPDDLLRLLNKKEKDKFFAALKHPSHGIVRELLESAELEKTRQLPWWEAPTDDSQSPLSPHFPYGVKPDLVVVPSGLINQAHGTSLLYNICVLFLAYSYVTRYLSTSPLGSARNDSQDHHVARKILLQAVPFLRDRRSKLLHVSLTDAVISFWSQLDPGRVDKKAMIILLEDLAIFVRPRRVITVGHSPSEDQQRTEADHPFSTTVMVISDIISLFSICTDSSHAEGRRNPVVMKLTFYLSHILSTPSSHLHVLADEVHLLSKSMAREA